MKTERVLHLLEVVKLYALKQCGFQQQPINKEVVEALDIAIEAVKQSENTISRETYEAWQKSVKALAEADVVPVVRCKNCKYRWKSWTGIVCGNVYAPFYSDEYSAQMNENDFCSYGEREVEK